MKDFEIHTVEELAKALKVNPSWVYGKTRETGPGAIPPNQGWEVHSLSIVRSPGLVRGKRKMSTMPYERNQGMDRRPLNARR